MHKGFNSQHWFPLFKKLAATYYDRADKDSIDFREKSIDEIALAYPIRLQAIKSIMFFNDSDINRIDRHKIIALYIQLFLEKKLFWLRPRECRPSNPNPATLLINEAFCIDLMRIIFQEWAGRRLDFANFEKYKSPFLKLLACYRKHSESHMPSPFNDFIFAHLIYFMEDKFFSSGSDLSAER